MDSDNIWVKGSSVKKKLNIYPGMWAKPKAGGTIFISDMQIKYAKPAALKMISDCL